MTRGRQSGGLRACALSSGTCKHRRSPLRASYRPRRFPHLIHVNRRAIAYPTDYRNLLLSLCYVSSCYS